MRLTVGRFWTRWMEFRGIVEGNMTLSEELRHCSETDRCDECQYGETETKLICKGLLEKTYEVVKRYEEMFPCKVGNIIYYPCEDFNFIFPVTISQIIISDLGEGRYCVQYNGCFFNGYGDPEKDFEFDTEDFGKTVFLTKEAAEKSLKEMEDRKNGEID